MRAFLPALACASIISCVGAAHADIVTFTQIPGALSANDITPDGRFIVGGTPDFQAYIYDTTTGVMTLIPGPGVSQAVAVSDDGQMVLGSMIDANGDEVAGIWKASTGTWTSMGYLPNAGQCPSRSNGYELSADGGVAVGLSWDGCSGRGFRWTADTGMQELQSLANGGNRASVVSADGNVIGGFAQGNFSRTPAVWTADGSGQLVENADILGEVHGINKAGTQLLAVRNNKAVIYSFPGLAVTQIGAGSLLPGWSGTPMDIADNGMVVGFDFLFGNRRAWIHPAGPGPMIELSA